MNYLLALVALASLMIVLSTVVSTAVEFIHKVFSLRRTGLQEMMRAMHDNVIAPMEEGRRPGPEILKNNGRTPEAARFANAVTKNPAFGGGGRWWWPSNWPLNIFQRRFERLTKRQFVQQLAQTEFGDRLAEAPRPVIASCIGKLVYEFDRYGLAQRQFFRRRAKVLAGLASLFFVTIANINVIDIYLHLSTNPISLNRALVADEVDRVADAVERLDDRVKVEELNLELERVQAAMVGLGQAQQLPIGEHYYPYCIDQTLDARCSAPIEHKKIMLCPFSLCAMHLETQDVPTPVARLLTSPTHGPSWLLAMIATAGLLGLGAPFWFDVFNRAAGLVASMTGRGVDTARTEQGAPIDMSDDAGLLSSDEVNSLTEAFLVAAGVNGFVEGGLWPDGGRLGESSSDAIVAGPAGDFEGEAMG